MCRIEGVVKDHPWGSLDAVPALLGVPATGAPIAEMWFGAHPGGPALLCDEPETSDAPDASGAPARTLADLLDQDPVAVLGEDVLDLFGPRLPYLLKVIAPARPLSLQVHPDLARARAGLAREEAAGVARGERNYVDANHKPELVLALTRFEAVCGFRAPRRAADLLRGLDAPLARAMARLLVAHPGRQGVARAFAMLMDPAQPPTAEQVADLARQCERRLAAGLSPSTRTDTHVVTLHRLHPGDAAVAATLLLNPVTLRPGEAMLVAPGIVHAHLEGLGVEVQASSDNVVRAGLTDKHVDRGELLACLQPLAAPPVRIAPERVGATSVFYAPVEDFELSLTRPEGGEVTLPGRGPRILLALHGAVRVQAPATGQQVELPVGGALLVRAADGPVRVRAAQGAHVVQAAVP